MSQTLINRIDERLTATGLSGRKACIRAQINPGTIDNIRNKGTIPAADKLAALAHVLGVSTDWLLGMNNAKGKDTTPKGSQVDNNLTKVEPVFVVGEVRAGVWLEAVEWHEDDWDEEYVPIDPEYAKYPRFALRVAGPSMNEVYPDGSYVVCVKFIELHDDPEDGDHVVVHRVRKNGLVEATIKEYAINDDGSIELRPKSTDPRFQEPLHFDPTAPDNDDEEIRITALVIGGYIPRPRRRRRIRLVR